MNVMVTGGAGFIGSHVVDTLIDRGHQTSVVDNLATGDKANLNPKAAFYEVDVADAQLSDVFAKEKPEVVLHLAAQMNVTLSIERPLFDAQTNILGSLNVLQQCHDHGARKFVLASSAGAVYGNTSELPATEETPCCPTSHYGTSKLSAEHYTRLYHRLYELSYTILRYTNTYGPRQTSHGECGVCSIFTDRMLHGKEVTLFGDGEPLRDYLFVSDIAAATVATLERGDGATLNISSGVGTSVLEIFEELRTILDYDKKPILKPLRAGEVEHIYANADPARKILDWRPKVSLADGLSKTVAFFQDRA